MKEKTKKDLLRENAEKIDALDNMVTSLVEFLKEKGVLTQEEWEKRIKPKIIRAKGLPKYRECKLRENERALCNRRWC